MAAAVFTLLHGSYKNFEDVQSPEKLYGLGMWEQVIRPCQRFCLAILGLEITMQSIGTALHLCQSNDQMDIMEKLQCYRIKISATLTTLGFCHQLQGRCKAYC